MKIVIYGVSRSGKDYLLKRIIKNLKYQNINAIHIKGSETLNELSMQQYGKTLKEITEKQKKNLRECFISIINERDKRYDVVFVDGHYSFIKKDNFDIVFTDEDKFCYDHFFYLDTPTDKIIEFSRKNPKRIEDKTIQLDDIECWKSFEKKELTEVCNKLNKELVILDGNTNNCIQFILLWIKEYSQRFSYKEIAERIADNFIKHNPICSEVMLIDCDNTLSENDVTYNFCDFLGIDENILKKIFFGNRYSSYQFFRIVQLYRNMDRYRINEAIKFATSKIILNQDVQKFIHNRTNDTYVIALTVGLLEVWKNKLQPLKQINDILGNSAINQQDFFITPLLKKYIAIAFKARGIHVLSIGDSIIDIPMLEESDIAYIVAHKKINQAVLQYFNQNSTSKILQIFTGQYRYPIAQFNEEN